MKILGIQSSEFQPIHIYVFRMNRIRLFLVRHGQTDYNLKHLLQGSGINSSLNQTGQNEAEKLKNTEKLLMKTDLIYSSPLERAVQTGEIVTGLKRDRRGRLKSLVIRRGPFFGSRL